MKSIVVEGIIGQETYARLNTDLARVSPGEDLTIYINSQGGDYLAAMDMAAAIRSRKANVTTVCETKAWSAAIPIFLEGEDRLIAENAVLHIHPTRARPNDHKTAEEFKDLSIQLDKLNGTIQTTLVSKTGLSEEKAKSIIENNTWLNAREALNLKIATKVVPISKVNEIVDYLPEDIVNYVQEKQKELKKMTLDELFAEFEIPVIENKTKEESLQEWLKKNKKPVSDKKEEIKPAPLPMTIINMVANARSSEIEALGSGDMPKFTPAQVKSYKELFASPTVIQNAVFDDKGNIVDNYDAIIKIAKEGPAILNLKEKSGGQKLDSDGKPVKSSWEKVINKNKKERVS